MFIKHVIAGWAVVAIMAGFAYAAEEFQLPLAVTEYSGADQAAVPICGGLPVVAPLSTGQRLRLFKDNGQELPVQVTPMLNTPDGKIRWVLVDFQDDLAAGQTQQYVLRPGRPMPPPQSLRIEETVQGLTVHTGRVSFTISHRKGFGLFEEVRTGGEVLLNQGRMSVVQLQRRQGWDDHSDWIPATYEASPPETIRLLYAGPMRVTLEVAGTFRDDPLGLQYRAWITAWTGQSRIAVKVSLCNSNPRQFTLASIARLRIVMESPRNLSHFVIGADHPIAAEGPDVSIAQGLHNVSRGRELGSACRAVDHGATVWAGRLVNDEGGWMSAAAGDGGFFVCDRYFFKDPSRRIAIEKNRLVLEPIAPRFPLLNDPSDRPMPLGQPWVSEGRWLYDCSHHSSEYLFDFRGDSAIPRQGALARQYRRPSLAMTAPVLYDMARFPISDADKLAGDDAVRRNISRFLLTNQPECFQAAQWLARQQCDTLAWRTDAWAWKDPVLSPAAASVRLPGNAMAIDRDGDGYGVALPLGPDADDADASVTTLDSAMEKAGDLKNLLERRGYKPRRILFISPSGDDRQGRIDHIENPFATFGRVRSFLRPGDMVIFRAGVYRGENVVGLINLNGSEDRPIVIMAMPGEKAVLDAKESAIEVRQSSHVILDGFVLDNTQGGYGQGLKTHFSHHVTLRNIESMHTYRGLYGGQDLHSIAIENCVVHDNLGSHGIYFGAQDKPNSDITIRDCVIYRNGLNGIQHNGRVTNLRIENNIIHSNKQGGVSLIQGVCQSVVRGNLIYNNNHPGVILYDYDEENRNLNILPYDQNDNCIERNLIWVGQYAWNDGSKGPSFHPAIRFNAATTQPVNMDGNIIRNNILCVYDGGGVLEFAQARLAAKTVVDGNILFRSLGADKVMVCGKTTLNLEQFNQYGPQIRDNQFQEPKFKDVSPRHYSQPESFNFSSGQASRFLSASQSLPQRLGLNFDMGPLSAALCDADAAELWAIRQIKTALDRQCLGGLIDYYCITGDRDALETARDLAEQFPSRRHLCPWGLRFLHMTRM